MLKIAGHAKGNELRPADNRLSGNKRSLLLGAAFDQFLRKVKTIRPAVFHKNAIGYVDNPDRRKIKNSGPYQIAHRGLLSINIYIYAARSSAQAVRNGAHRRRQPV
jgi:hypothetical protein